MGQRVIAAGATMVGVLVGCVAAVLLFATDASATPRGTAPTGSPATAGFVGMGALRAIGWGLVAPTTLPNRLDAVAVHGGGGADGRREAAALELLHRGRVATIVAMGGPLPSGDPDGTYAGAVKRRLLKLGAPASRIVQLDEGQTTATELRALRALAEQRGWKEIALCSDAWHTRRITAEADRVFAGSGIHWYVVAAPSNDFDPDRWWQTDSGRARVAGEWAKLALGWLHAY